MGRGFKSPREANRDLAGLLTQISGFGIRTMAGFTVIFLFFLASGLFATSPATLTAGVAPVVGAPISVKGVVVDLGEDQYGTMAGPVLWETTQKKFYLLNPVDRGSLEGKADKAVSGTLRPFEGNIEGPPVPVKLSEFAIVELKILSGKDGEAIQAQYDQDKALRTENLNEMLLQQSEWTRRMDEFMEKTGEFVEGASGPALVPAPK